MNKQATITLIATEYTVDEIGQQIETETETEVYASISSVTGVEWHEAGRNGIKAMYKMRVFEYDYDGQLVVRYNGKTYGVYRTYLAKHDYIELYVAEKAGNE